MKKALMLCLMIVVVALSGKALAGWGLTGVPGGKTSAPAVDVNALTARSICYEKTGGACNDCVGKWTC